MEETLNDSKSFTSASKQNKITFPWRDIKLRRQFHWSEFVDPKLKKITLVSEKNGIFYVMELIDKPTKWFLQGEEVKASTWYRYTVSNSEEFYEWGLVRIVKQINNLLRLGCVIKEIVQ